MATRLLAAVLVAASLSAVRAQTSPFTRYLGGGGARTDCMLVTDVAGAAGTNAARCTDGDPACDADGVANGSCTFRVRLCLDATDPRLPRCAADAVTAASATLAAVEAVLQALPMPVTTPDTCTGDAQVTVPRRGASGRTVVRATATMASGHRDRDRVALVCRRPAATATFATIERKIFAVSCALPSCHGAASAGGLTLTTGAAYVNLVGVPATNAVAHAAGLLRVAPGDPDHSFILDKLTGTLASGEGAQMPYVGSPLPPADIALIRRWITAGAPADAPF